MISKFSGSYCSKLWEVLPKLFADFSGRYHNQPGRDPIDIVTAFINKIRYLFFGPSPFPIQREGAEKVVKLSDGKMRTEMQCRGGFRPAIKSLWFRVPVSC